MSEQPEDELAPAEIESVLEQVVRNQLKIKELTEQNDMLKAYFKVNPEGFPVGSTTKHGKFYVKVKKNARINEQLAQTQISATKYKQITKTVVDAAKAKQYLTGADYEAIQKVFDPAIEIGMN